jgi:chitinase
MTAIGDAAIVASLIIDIIDMYHSKGIEVDLDTLEERIADLKARKDAANKKLKR